MLRYALAVAAAAALISTAAFAEVGDMGTTKVITKSSPDGMAHKKVVIHRNDNAHSAGALLVVDSTAASPVLTRPLSLGADIVMHSATKYLNGHSDVIAGSLAAAREDALWTRIKQVRSHHGAILGPFEAWLVLRGLRTLEVRVRAQAESAALLATRFANHQSVSMVLYPGLPSHPGHAVAGRQVSGLSALPSIRCDGGQLAANDAA